MKKYTKLMGILLALVMLIALVPMTAMADNQTYPPDTDAPENLLHFFICYGKLHPFAHQKASTLLALVL